MSKQLQETLSSQSLKKAYDFLEDQGLLTSANMAMLADEIDPYSLARALCFFREELSMPMDIRAWLKAHHNPFGLVESLECLQRGSLFTPDHKAIVSRHPNSLLLAAELNFLQQAKILVPDNFILIAKHPNPKDLAFILLLLDQAKILTPQTRELLLTYQTPTKLVSGLSTQAKIGKLTEEKLSLLIAHFNPNGLSMLCWSIEEQGIAIDKHLPMLPHCKDPLALSNLIFRIKAAGIVMEDKDVSRLLELDVGNIKDLTNILLMMNQSLRLTPATFQQVLYEENLDCLNSAISLLFQGGNLRVGSVSLILAQKKFCEILSALEKAGIKSRESLYVAFRHYQNESWVKVILKLSTLGMLTLSNFKACMDNPKIAMIWHGLDCLKEDELITQANFALLLNHPRPDKLGDALNILFSNEILTEDYIENISSVYLCADMAYAYADLRVNGLLTPRNCFALTDLSLSDYRFSALSYMSISGILTQENFDALVSYEHREILTEELVEQWERFVNRNLTQDDFDLLLHAIEEGDHEVFTHAVDAILENRRPDAMVLNDAQSTHVTSVHRMVSEATRKLHERYQDSFVLADKLEEIKADVLRLPSSLKHDAAKRRLDVIMQLDHTNSFGISLKQLLALAYVAIHDESRRSGLLEDAKSQFYEGLYEIQRGYNINRLGIDNGLADAPICTGGSYHKIIEKLNGIHSDVEIYFITHAGALGKLPSLTREKLVHYLMTKASPADACGFLEMSATLEKLKTDENLESIWDKISSLVLDVLWDEFAEAYHHNRQDPRFVVLQTYGKEVGTPDLSMVEQALMASEGARLHQARGMVNFGLFATDVEQDGENPQFKRQRTG